MAVPSTMLPLGTQAPDFRVKDVVTGKWLALGDFSKFNLFLVMFICKHCPYVKHIQDQLARLGFDYSTRNVGMVGISSNDAQNYPEDSPEGLREMAQSLKLNFPLGYDESQEAAKAYRKLLSTYFRVLA